MSTLVKEQVDIKVLRQYQSSLKARAALQGIEVKCFADGRYMASQPGVAKTFKTLPDLEVWLIRAGA